MIGGGIFEFLASHSGDDEEDWIEKADVFVQRVSEAKKIASTTNDLLAKEYWCVLEALKAQRFYISAFHYLKKGSYYEAWCEFARSEGVLIHLARHFKNNWTRTRLDFVERYIEKWQSLFPYKVFFSPEILEHEKKCNICDKVVLIRSPCGHQVGEIYGGEQCIRIVTKQELLGLSVVDHPVQKYSVAFNTDPETNQKIDHYDYHLVEFAIRRLQHPFITWEYELTKTLHPHSNYSHIGRNAPCPCGAPQKYKRCCLLQSGVLRPHYEFSFGNPLTEDLRETEYSRSH